MGTENLKRYSCDGCDEEVIASSTPKGWVRIVSSDQRGTEGGRRHYSPQYRGHPPFLWTPSELGPFPDDAHWCSPACLSDWVYREAQKIVEEASKGTGVPRGSL